MREKGDYLNEKLVEQYTGCGRKKMPRFKRKAEKAVSLERISFLPEQEYEGKCMKELRKCNGYTYTTERKYFKKVFR